MAERRRIAFTRQRSLVRIQYRPQQRRWSERCSVRSVPTSQPVVPLACPKSPISSGQEGFWTGGGGHRWSFADRVQRLGDVIRGDRPGAAEVARTADRTLVVLCRVHVASSLADEVGASPEQPRQPPGPRSPGRPCGRGPRGWVNAWASPKGLSDCCAERARRWPPGRTSRCFARMRARTERGGRRARRVPPVPLWLARRWRDRQRLLPRRAPTGACSSQLPRLPRQGPTAGGRVSRLSSLGWGPSLLGHQGRVPDEPHG